MPDAMPPMTVALTWDGELQFTGQAGRHEVTVDGSTYTAPSPMQMLALSLAGCMAIDLVHILQKGRYTLSSLRAQFSGQRAPESPKRFTHVELHFLITTSAPEAPVPRAIDLSREKYCSVWQSLRQDIEFAVTFAVTAAS